MNGRHRCSGALLTAAAVLAANCFLPVPEPSETEITNELVEIGEAHSAEVRIRMGVGTLHLAGGAGGLLDAEFRYNIPAWKPEVSYRIDGGRGRLDVSQPSSVIGAALPGSVRYEWDLKLGAGLPIDLKIDIGVGKSELDLAGLELNSLRVDAGVGEGTIDLASLKRADLDVEIEAGIGRLLLKLPSAVGVTVEVEGGLGQVEVSGLAREGVRYVNEAWRTTGSGMRIDIEGGIGQVELLVEEGNDPPR